MSIQILDLTNKTRVKNLCIAWNLFKNDGFIKDNKFFKDNNLRNIFLNSLTIFFYLDSSIKVAFIKDAYFETIYINIASAIKRLKIHLQFFQILKIRSFKLKI